MRTLPFLIAGALLACGCSAQAAREPAAPAPVTTAASSAVAAGVEGNWRFVELAGVPVPPGVTATLRLHGGHASGKAGCNAYGASWTSVNGKASFGAPRSTKMACLTPAGAMQVERGVFNALGHTAKIETGDGQLLLLDASGKTMAKLVPIDPR